MTHLLLATLILCLAASMAAADEATTKPATPAAPAQDQPDYENFVRRDHDTGGMTYRTVAATLPMKDDAGTTRGTMFFTHYVLLDAGRPVHETRPRPITYVFNGGPGAASVWLHLGTAGPMRVDLPGDGTPPPPPHLLVENADSWLPATDLVFIDPVGTGFSRAAFKEQDGEDNPQDFGKQFYGVAEDVRWVGEFIRLHCTRFGRWDDPKYLAGESYGTTRAAQLALDLHNRFGMDVSGVMLISTVLDFATIRTADNNPLPHVAFLPTYAATAAYHGKIDLTPDDARRKAAEFAETIYLPALLRGAALPDDKRRAVAEDYAQLTGLPTEYVLAADLKVDPARFMKKLLEDRREVVGRMDGRLTGFAPDAVADTPDTDPSLGGYYGPYSGGFNDYVRKTLGYESDLAYEVLSRRVHPWNATPESTASYSGGYLDVSDDLQHAMNRIPGLRLFVASGIYDLATPVHGADYTVAQMKLSPAARERVTQKNYAGGHMMYHVAEERVRLGEDVRAFVGGGD